MFTTDTRKAHCPIRIVYTSAAVGPYHANELAERPSFAGMSIARLRPLAIIRETEHSDYSGGDVQASNYRVLAEAKDMDDLVEIYGSHGYKALAYDATLGPVPTCEALCDVLENLEQYPLIDEDDHSELESDLEMEAWGDHGLDDFRNALEPLLNIIDPGHDHELPDNETRAPKALADAASDYLHNCSVAGTWETLLWEVWRSGCDQLNVNGGTGFAIQTGCTVHFYVDDWCGKAGTDSRYATDKPIHALIREIAEACRVTRASNMATTDTELEAKTQYSNGYDRGNYGNAYESGDWEAWAERNEFTERSKAYRDGMVMGFFSSYELHEIDDEIMRDHVEALRGKYGDD